MKHRMIVLNQRGDSRMEWDPKDETEIGKAKIEFEKLVRKGYSGISSRSKTKLDSFQSEQEEILMIPRLVGG